MSWKKDQEWEANWWDTCANTFWEETKQIVYAQKMGLVADVDYGHYPVYALKGISVVDIGGGPVSMLLKCKDVKGTVVDPCEYPEWVAKRYDNSKITYLKMPAEDFNADPDMPYDEAWIYNCLQHTIDPQKIIENAKKVSKLIRIFEWIDEPVSIGHPQMLTKDSLNTWLGGVGKVEDINQQGCHGRCYYGIFKGNHYEE